MAGFFGLFGSKTKYVDEENNNEEQQASKESFFLSPDDAKTYGNIDYMRTSKKVRRTFPKTRSNKNTELIVDVASIKDNGTSSQQATSQPAAAVKAEPKATPQPTVAKAESNTTTEITQNNTTNPEERRRADTSMDMFRNMARQINK